MEIFAILYGTYYPPHREFKLICIGKFSRRTWVNFTQQYGKNRQRCQQNKFYYALWQLLLYYYTEFPSKILSVYHCTLSLYFISILYVSCSCVIKTLFFRKINDVHWNCSFWLSVVLLCCSFFTRSLSSVSVWSFFERGENRTFVLLLTSMRTFGRFPTGRMTWGFYWIGLRLKP